jgi:hypothetical protein
MPSSRVRGLVLILTAAVLAALLSPVAGAVPRVHADAPLPQTVVQSFSRDVYVIVGPSLRNPDDSTAPGAALFNVDCVPLGLTWGDWQRATAIETAHGIGNGSTARTDVGIQLAGLIPGGVYSLFYGTLTPDSENPLARTSSARSP